MVGVRDRKARSDRYSADCSYRGYPVPLLPSRGTIVRDGEIGHSRPFRHAERALAEFDRGRFDDAAAAFAEAGLEPAWHPDVGPCLGVRLGSRVTLPEELAAVAVEGGERSRADWWLPVQSVPAS